MFKMKSICLTLVLSVTCLATLQPRAEAMLVPASAITINAQTDRPADLQTIQKTLESKILREKLHALGLSDTEIQARLSRLSDSEVHQLASQIKGVNPAGGILIGLLIAVVLVLLIIYLLKRIL